MRSSNILFETALLSVCLSAQVPLQPQSSKCSDLDANGADGNTPGNKIDSKCRSLAGTQGVVIMPSGMAPGDSAKGIPSRCFVMDYRGNTAIEPYGTVDGDEQLNLVLRSSESRASNLHPNNYQGYGNLQFNYQALAGGNNSYNGKSGSKTNYFDGYFASGFRTVGQKVGIANNLYSTSAGDTLPFEIYVNQFGGYGTTGDEQTVGIEDLFYQGDGTKDHLGGVAKGTITAINASTGVVSYTPVSGEGTMGEQRFIRDISSKYVTGTYSAASNSAGSPNTITITGRGTSWSSILGFVGTHTTFNNLATGGEVLTNNLVFCADGGANDGYDFCMPITKGIDDTHLTLNLYASGTAMNTSWPANIPTSGTYAIYRAAWPTAVDLVNHTFTACNPMVAPSIGTCDVSGITKGHTFDQVMAYNTQFTGLRMGFNRAIGIPYTGGGIDIQNQGDSSSPKMMEALEVDGNFHRVIGVGYDGQVGAPDYAIDAHKDFHVWFISRAGGRTPINFFQYLDSTDSVKTPISFNRDSASDPGINFYGIRTFDPQGVEHEGGAAPTVKGGSTSLIWGTNGAGQVAFTSNDTITTVTFANAWTSHASCTANFSTPISVGVSASGSAATFTIPSAAAGTLNYHCDGK